MKLSLRTLGAILLSFALFASGCEERIDRVTHVEAHLGRYRPEDQTFSVMVSWRTVDNASEYEVERAAPDDGTDWTSIHWGPGREFEDFGRLMPKDLLVAGHTYKYRVGGRNGRNADWSPEVSITLPPFFPPENLTATYQESQGRVRLMWEAESVTGSGFEIERSGSPGDSWQRIGEVDDDAAHILEDGQVAPGFSYYYRVRRHHGQYGQTSYGNTVVVDMPAAPAPSMLDASRGEDEVISVRFQPLSEQIEANVSYELWRSEGNPENDGSYTRLNVNFQYSGSNLIVHDGSVEEGRWYHYKARAIIQCYSSGDIAESALSLDHVSGFAGPHAPGQAPPAPANLELTPRDWASSIGIRWDRISTADTYRIYRMAAGPSVDPNEDIDPDSFSSIFEGGPDDLMNYWEQYEWVDHSVEEGRRYYYFVTAVNEFGEGPRSEVKSTSVGDVGIPGQPEISATDGDYRNAIVVSWGPVNRGDWFRVFRVEGNQIVETLSPWIRERSFVYYTNQDTRFSVGARSDFGIEGPESLFVLGRVDSSAPEYTEPSNGNGNGPGEVEYDWNALGDVPIASGERVIEALVGCTSDGDVYIAALEDPSIAYDYGKPFIARYSAGAWSSLPDLPAEIMESNTVGIWMDIAADGGKVFFSASDQHNAYVYEYQAGAWSGNLAADHFGYDEKPSALTVAALDSQPHVGIVAPDSGNLRILRYDGTAWTGAGGDGYLNSQERVLDVALDAFGDTIYVIYRVADEGADEAELRIQSLGASGSWQTELEWTHDYSDMHMPLENTQIVRAPDGTLYFNHGGPRSIYKVTSSSTVEDLRASWCADPLSISVDSENRVIGACQVWDMDSELMAYPVVGVLDGGDWAIVSGDFSTGSRPVYVTTLGTNILFVSGDADSWPEMRNMPTVLRSHLFTR